MCCFSCAGSSKNEVEASRAPEVESLAHFKHNHSISEWNLAMCDIHSYVDANMLSGDSQSSKTQT